MLLPKKTSLNHNSYTIIFLVNNFFNHVMLHHFNYSKKLVMQLFTHAHTNANLNHKQNKQKHTKVIQNISLSCKSLVTPPTLKLDIVLNVQNIKQRKEKEDILECRCSYKPLMGSSASRATSSSCWA